MRETTSSEMQVVASEILLALGGAYAEIGQQVAKTSAWWDLLPKKGSPCDYSDSESYFRAAVASDLWKKFDFPGDAVKRREAAWSKWLASEKQCYRTNVRFDDYLRGGQLYMELPPSIKEFLLDIQKEVKFILGRVPNHIDPRFGPGATFDTRGPYQCSVPSKISSLPTMTPNSWPFLADWGGTLWGRHVAGKSFQEFGGDQPLVGDPCLVPGNRYETVRKNRLTDRSIAIEPSLNVFYQLAYGAHLKKRLRRFGQLLKPTSECDSESQAIHRDAARRGSIDGSLCTIDLSAASDTVAISFVEWALSSEWYSLLSSLRSPCTVRDGHSYFLEKFSSMGNGFTFELETLLFFSICRVTLRSLNEDINSIKVYGDDIIVPTNCYRSVIAALRFCGFSINTDKSFSSGPFRESCGGDFFVGVDVRPPSIPGEPSSPLDWIVIHNQLIRLRGRVDDLHLGNALNLCIDNIPRHLRLFGPKALGDNVLHGPSNRWITRMQSYSSPDRTARRGSPIAHIRCVRSSPATAKWSRWDEYSAACSRVYGVSGPSVPLRGAPDQFTVGWTPLTPGLEDASLVDPTVH